MAWYLWVPLGIIAALGAFIYAFLQRDADFAVVKALKRMPRDAFAGKVAWITGASSGIGEALAYELARRGATLVLSARRMDKLMEVQKKCLDEGSPAVEVVRLDVEELNSHAKIAEHVFKKFPKVHYLINNAGRSQRCLQEKTPIEVDQQMFHLNVFGVISLTKAVLPYFIKQNEGHIINTSSIAGKVGSPCSATYSGTKHAIQGYFDALRMEIADYNIAVTNVCPGPVASEITLHAFTENVGEKFSKSQEESIKRMPAARCAELMAAAMWAQLPEIWVSPQPILTYLYLAQYLPNLYFKLSLKGGRAAVAGFKSGKPTYTSLQNIWSLLGCGKRESKSKSE